MASTADSLVKSLAQVDGSSFATEAERFQAKEALYAALRRVQTPWDVAMDHVWTEPATVATIKSLIDAGFWKKWVAAGGQPANIESLAKTGGIDPVLLRRFLRHLAGQHIVTETGEDTFALTPYTRELAEEKFPSLYSFLYGLNQPCFANFPKFIAETNYINPSDGANSNTQSWLGPGQSVFAMLGAKPEMGAHFNNTMTVYSAAKTPWVDVYPAESIVAAAKPGHALVVDVGGGNGHDLEKFRARYPDVPAGSLIVQDLPHVVEPVTVHEPTVVKQGYDFFTPEPVKGARVYYLHCVLHDWDDGKAVEILKNLVPALERGYSRILLHETVIAPKAAHPRSTLSDMVMMMSFSSTERTEQQWRQLVAQAGLKVVNIFTTPAADESVIELELS